MNNEVKDTVSGRKYLERTALAITGKPYTTDVLSELLLHVTQLAGVTLPVQTAIRAVAFILEEKAINKTADTIAKLVVTAISPHITKLQETEQAISKTSSDTLAKALIQDTQLTNIHSSLKEVSTRLDNIPPAKTYAAAAAALGNLSQMPKVAQDTQDIQRLAREAIKDRQLLIDFPASSQLAAGNSSHAQLVNKTCAALKSLPKKNDTDPDLELRVVTQFKQGGMVIEMTSKEAADFIRNDKDTRDALLNHLDSNATLKERTYSIIIPFMPLTFNPTNRKELDAMENENRWPAGTIVTARWIKPAEKRKVTQQVAHMLVTLKDPSAANTAIRDGITYNLLKLWPHKNKREPLRCAKCQCYNHIARECTSQVDVCANCGNNHHTNDCTTRDKKYCVSCESEDHTSSHRDCPMFRRNCDNMDRRYPDNKIPYFPTLEPWTQAPAPENPAPYRKPPIYNSFSPPVGTQQMLDEFPARTQDPNHGRNPGHTNRRTSVNRPTWGRDRECHEWQQYPMDYAQNTPADDPQFTSGWDV